MLGSAGMRTRWVRRKFRQPPGCRCYVPRMLKKILLGLAAVIVVLAIVVSTRPDKYRVERSAKIAAPAEVVFASVSDLRAWQEWSPWEKRDPAMRRTFSSATSGVGASYEWAGNKDVGTG